VAALCVYVATCSPGIEWQDSGIHQYRILSGQLVHDRGLALSHPLHYWLGRAMLAVPVGDPIWRLNLLSAICGAVAVGLLAATLERLTRSRLAAMLGAGVLLVAHSFWQMSALTETYTVAAALMTLEWYLLLVYARSRSSGLLVLVFLVNGLHVADHLLGLLTLATYGVLVLDRLWRGHLAWRWTPVLAVAWLIGAAPYWALVLAFHGQVGDWTTTIRSAFFGGGAGDPGWGDAVLNTRVSVGQAKLALLTLAYNFPSAALAVALGGVVRPAHGRRRVFRAVLLGQTVLIGAFVGRYAIADLYTYFVPVCVLVGLWCGVGADWLLGWVRRSAWRPWAVGLLTANVLAPVVVYACFPIVAESHGWMRSRLRDIPFRNEYRHFFCPWRVGDDSAARFARAVLERAGPSGWLLMDTTTAHAVGTYYRLHGGPAGIRIYNGHRCLNVPNWPHLTEEELAAFVRAGGRVVVVPGAQAERLWGERFALDRSDGQFWLVRPAGAGQGTENEVDLPSPGEGMP
jgi:hypothetical protein